MQEHSGMGVNDEPVAEEHGTQPDDQGSHDRWTGDEYQRGTLRRQDARSLEALEQILDGGQSGNFELQVVDEIRAGADLLRERVTPPAVRIPSDEYPGPRPGSFLLPPEDGWAAVRRTFFAGHVIAAVRREWVWKGTDASFGVLAPLIPRSRRDSECSVIASR